MHRDDDAAWRAIVDNYGDRADLGPDPEHGPVDEDLRAVEADHPDPASLGADPAWEEREDPQDRFVPPTPPPVPATTADRYAAWAGVFGAPAVLLAVVVLRIDLHPVLGYGLVAAFVGGFAYLVARMPREPRDPGDDGARI